MNIVTRQRCPEIVVGNMYMYICMHLHVYTRRMVSRSDNIVNCIIDYGIIVCLKGTLYSLRCNTIIDIPVNSGFYT